MPKGSAEDVQLLNSMFDQMTGTSHAEPEIIIPKYNKLYNGVRKFHKVFSLFSTMKNFDKDFPESKTGLDEIQTFLGKIQTLLGDIPEADSDELKALDKTQANETFTQLKDSVEVQQIIITSSVLRKHKRYLEDSANLNDDFIRREPGLSMTPLSFSNIDLKLIWVSDNFNNMTKKFILSILSHAYKIGYEVYDLVTSPNIDIQKFSHVLINNIGMLKKQIPRCDKAFDIISDSVKMLEGNFNGYYKTSVEAENPSVIIESFIVDVSMKQKSNATVTRQFRKIIMYMKKKSANNKDPRVKKLFGILNSQFSLMEKETPGYVKPDDKDDDEEEEGPKNEEGTKNEEGPKNETGESTS